MVHPAGWQGDLGFGRCWRRTCAGCDWPRGFRRTRIAADAGVFQKLISGIENGRANPELDTLGKIAAALGVHPGELLKE